MSILVRLLVRSRLWPIVLILVAGCADLGTKPYSTGPPIPGTGCPLERAPTWLHARPISSRFVYVIWDAADPTRSPASPPDGPGTITWRHFSGLRTVGEIDCFARSCVRGRRCLRARRDRALVRKNAL